LLAFALAWLAPGPEWFFAVFVLLGVNLGAVIVSGILVVLEFCPPEKRPTYTGLANTAVGVVSAGAPLIGAGLATASYEWLFALSMSVNVMALVVMRWWVQEPRLVGREKWIVDS
jgi:MFS family permease